MSLFKYGDFEIELDFTDADTLAAIEEAYEKMQEDIKKLPKTGRISEIIMAQNVVYDDFFNTFMGEGASSSMFQTNSLEQRIDAAEKLADFRFREDERFYGRVEKFQVNKPANKPLNRKQKRRNPKNHRNRG